MKLKTLEIHNIASIEDATIDFNGPELGSQDIFLICGPTGSGKTTILDAICLALFDSTPRMEKSSSDKINAFENTDSNALSKIKDVLHLVRKNAVEAGVKLSFEANGNAYTAIWRAYRNNQYRKGKEVSSFSSLSLEEKLKREFKKEWTLIDENGDAIIKNVATAIQDIIRMSFTQFCKTTMLAQGDFTKFLSSSAHDKADILEKLVGTEKYSEVGKVINETYNKKKRDIESKEHELKDIQLLSDEEKESISENISCIGEKLKALKQQDDATKEKLGWILKKEEIEKEKIQREKALENAQALCDLEETRCKQTDLELWNQTASVREAINAKNKCEATARELLVQKENLQGRYQHLISGFAYLSASVGKLSSAIEHDKQELQKNQEFEPMFLNAAVICSKHSEMVRNENIVNETLPKIEASAKELERLRKEVTELETLKAQYENEIQEQDLSKAEWDQEMVKLGCQTIDRDMETVGTKLETANAAIRAIAELERAQKEAADKKRQKKEAEESLDAKQKEVAEKGVNAEASEKRAQESKDCYEKAYAALNNHAKALRVNLQVGDLCPVCRNRVTELLSEDELAKSLKPLEDAYRKLEADSKSANNLLNQANAELGAITRQLKFLRDEAQKKEKEAENCKTAANGSLAKLGLTISESTNANLEQIKSGFESELQTIRERQKQIKKIRDEIKAIELAIADIRKKKLNPADKNLQALNGKVNQIGSEKAAWEGKKRNSEQAASLIKKELEDLINPNWEPTVGTDFFTALRTEADRYMALKKAVETNIQKLEGQKLQIDMTGNVKRSIFECFPEWRSMEVESVMEIKELASEFTNLNADVISLQNKNLLNIEAQENARAAISSFMESSPEISMIQIQRLMDIPEADIKTMAEDLEKLSRNLTNAKTLLEEILKREAQMPPNPLSPEENFETLSEAASNCEAERTKMAEERGRFNNILENDKKDKEKYGKAKADLQNRIAELADWETLNNYLGNTDGKNFRFVAQSFILSELLDKANAYLENISTRYSLFCYPGTLTIMMRDAYQGGAVRATNTLSGGESFIISLSLALGLSSMQNVNLEVDTLFIDEGFGTLSPEFMDPVITALKRLNQSYGRRVGIISHMDALKQRLPVVIEVTKHGTSSSRIQITYN